MYKRQVFGIVEDVSELKTNGIVNMLLYHDANSDGEYYNRRAYISVPVSYTHLDVYKRQVLISVVANGQAKYVFYFIGDGMGVNQVNGTEMRCV